jgi:hypothetical protein
MTTTESDRTLRQSAVLGEGRVFQAVRAARMSALPTRRRVLADIWATLVGAVISVLMWMNVSDFGGLLFVAAAMLATGGTVYSGARAVGRGKAVARKRPVSDVLDKFEESKATGLGEKTMNAASAAFARDWELSVEVVGDIAADLVAAAVQRGKPARVARLRDKLGATTPHESPVLVCQGAYGPDVPTNALLLVTFGVAAFWVARPVDVCLTERRLRVYRHRRKRVGEVLFDAQLEDLRVREWHKSTSPLQPRHRILRLTGGGRKIRLAIPVYWRDEVQLLFDRLYARQLTNEASAMAGAAR